MKLRKRFLHALVIAVLAMTLLGASPDNQARYTKIGHEMMCMCGCGQVLLECNHVGCTVSDKMAKQLRARLDQGMSDEDIKQAFIQEYGTVVLAAPTTKGFDRVAWIMPFVIFGLGVGAVVYVVKIWRGRLAPVPAVTTSAAPEHVDELRRRAREETEV